MNMADNGAVIDDVKDYYGKQLKTKEDLKTNACKTACGPTLPHIRNTLKLIHDEVVSKYYGCGMVIPDCLEGTSILDLGSGSGRDCYVLSKLVGENGHVTGVDMTDEQLEVANRHIDYHRQKFGYKKANIDFVKGYIEKLDQCGLKDATYDIIVSNCVVNLSPDKPAVLREAYRLLKEGGELYFSDVYADRDLPEHIRKHKVLWGECIAGALWWKELLNIASEVGFSRPRIVEGNESVIEDPALKEVVAVDYLDTMEKMQKRQGSILHPPGFSRLCKMMPTSIQDKCYRSSKRTGGAKFASITYRLFKLPASRQPDSEVMYDGSVTGCANKLKFDYNHTFKTESIATVDGEIATILKSSRFSDCFEIRPTKNTPCSPTEDIVDPFEYLEKCTKSGGSCCAPSDNCGPQGCGPTKCC